MSAASVARKLAEAGLDALSIVAALEAFEAVDEERRAKTRERKRRQRAKEAATERDVTRQDVTERDTPAPSLSPQTPLTHPHPRVDITTRARDDGFAVFWAAYPSKKSKPQAEKAFRKAISKTDLPVLLAAVETQRLWPQWQDGFIPHAATWLNNERWADEPDPQRKARDRPNPSPKLDHLERVSRAMAASIDGSDGERRDDWEEPGPEGRGGFTPRVITGSRG